MTQSVKHPTVVGPNDPTKQVSKTVYEAAHTLVDVASLSGGLVPNGELASSGTADATTFLRGDRTWAAPSGGGLVSWTQSVNELGASFAAWLSGGGTWDSDGTVIRQTNNAGAYAYARYNTILPLGLPFVLEAEVKVVSGAGGNRICGIQIYDGGTTGGIGFRIDTESNQWTIEHQGISSLIQVTMALAEGTFYKLRIVGGNDVWSFYIDGVLVQSAFAHAFGPSIGANYVGLYTFGSVGNFRNIKVYTLSVPA